MRRIAVGAGFILSMGLFSSCCYRFYSIGKTIVSNATNTDRTVNVS